MPPLTGSYRSDLTYFKDLVDFWLTRYPRLYLAVEQFREWQNWDKRVYLSFVRKGDIVLDIGANVGAHSVAFSHLAGKHGRVLSFEPVPENFRRLQETIKSRARFSNISVFRLAIGNPGPTDQHVTVKVPGGDFTQASLTPHSAGSWDRNAQISRYSCQITSLDAQVKSAGLPRIDFLKIDVEGGELDVLRGAAGTLMEHRPYVYCEVFNEWAASFEYTAADIFKLMGSLGYTGARVIGEGSVHGWRLGDPVPTQMFEKSSDVLFFSVEHASRVADFDRRYPSQTEA